MVRQDGNVALVALFCAGAKGGVVLGLPGITLLRSGDRFVRLAEAYSPDSPATLAQPVADALAIPQGVEAGAVSAVLAAEITLAAGKPWAGQAVTGTVVDYGDGAAYLEPDLQKAMGVPAATGTGS